MTSRQTHSVAKFGKTMHTEDKRSERGREEGRERTEGEGERE